jgi:signal transduction histidine kinase/CheY-like chemotaxis protein
MRVGQAKALGSAGTDERVIMLVSGACPLTAECALLRAAGLQVDVAADAAAVERALSVSAGAVVAPSSARLEVEAARVRGIPVVLLVDHPLALGDELMVARPWASGLLLSAVQTALRVSRLEREARTLSAALADGARKQEEFLAMLGHELRNPLFAIQNALAVPGAGDVARASQKDVIARQSEHLCRIVDDLLDVSRLTRGKIALQRRAVDLATLVPACVHTFHALGLVEHEVSLEVAGPVTVDGDPLRLEQVFMNILDNAVKYTPAGGRIAVSVRQVGMWAVVRVRDSGVGITGDLLPHVFDLFAQAQQSLDRPHGGLGLGLSLVRGLVDLHGGTVRARSAGTGKGSEFVVRLPCDERARAVEVSCLPAAAAQVPGAARSLSILVVEDNDDGREMLDLVLRAWGHDVALACDGAEALERVRARTPEVVLLDIGLPGLSGYEVARRVREQRGPSPRLIAMTGYGQPEDRQRALEAGFDAHLVKPVRPDALARLLECVG